MEGPVLTDKIAKRLALGRAPYNSIRAALVERIATLEAQKDLAFSTDFAD